MVLTANPSRQLQRKRRFDKGAAFFYISMIALPLIQFIIFYVIVNFNSIILAFKHYEIVDVGGTQTLVTNWYGWRNFQAIFGYFQNEGTLWKATKNSFLFLAINLVLINPLSMLFAYYIHKGYPGAKAFKIMLYLPAVICSMIFVIFYLNFADAIFPAIAKAWFNEDIATVFRGSSFNLLYIIIFYVFMSFSGSILLYINAMGAISPSVIEAAVIDGSGEFRIFLNIVLPAIWKTLVSFIVLNFAAIASNEAYMFAIYGVFAPEQAYTLGYYEFRLVAIHGGDSPVDYPLASAFGLLCTAVVAPLTLLARHLFNRFGPSED